MEHRRSPPPTPEKLEALAAAISSEDHGQRALAADLLARLTEDRDNVVTLCKHRKGPPLLETCLTIATEDSLEGGAESRDVRADVLTVLHNALAVAEGRAIVTAGQQLRRVLSRPPGPDSAEAAASTLVSHERMAWLRLARAAFATAAEEFAASAEERHRLHRAVLEICREETAETWAEGLLLLCYLHENAEVSLADDSETFPSSPRSSEEAKEMAVLLRRVLKEVLDISEPGFGTAPEPPPPPFEVIRAAAAMRSAEVDTRKWEEAKEDDESTRPRERRPPRNKATQPPALGNPASPSPGPSLNPASRQLALCGLRLLAAGAAHLPRLPAELLSFTGEPDMLKVDQARDLELLAEAPGVKGALSVFSQLIAIVRRGDFALQPCAWKALVAVSGCCSLSRWLLRLQPEIAGLLRALQRALAAAAGASERQDCAHEDGSHWTQLCNPQQRRALGEEAVAFLKQLFTGATDQFSCNDSIMADHLGGAEGLKSLLVNLLCSWKSNAGNLHRGNIVAVFADTMFFSAFTDVWQQQHPEAEELVSVLFDALLWKDVEGTAGLALGNFVSANNHIDLILEHQRAEHSLSNVGWFLRRSTPSWHTKMQIYYLWRVLRCRRGCRLLSRHPNSDLIVAGLLRGVAFATVEDNEVLSLLECLLKEPETKPLILRGQNATALLEGISELLSGSEKQDLAEVSCALLQALLDATGHGPLLCWRGAGKLLDSLSRCQAGKEILDQYMPAFQFESTLVASLSLEYKRAWVSDQIRSSGHGDPVHLTVSRESLLEDLREGLADTIAEGRRLRFGFQVNLAGAGETGGGAGHRREVFRLAAQKLLDLELGLFRSYDGGHTLHPSCTAIGGEPWGLALFELVGKLIALCLLHRETLPGARFTLPMRKLLLGQGPVSIEDMAAMDPEFVRHKVQYILESKYEEGESPMSLETLDLVFEDTPQPDIFPDVHLELCPSGSQMPVTEENKQHYIDLLCDSRMKGSVSRQLGAMMQGLRAVIPEKALEQIQRVLSPEDLELLLCGLQELDIADWRNNSDRDETVDEETWEMFWEIVTEMPSQEQRNLLEFVTGSPGPPVGGFKALPGHGAIGSIHPFTISRSLHGKMPVAATCFNTLYLPKYASKDEMSAALKEAIASREAGGFLEAAVAGAANGPNGCS